MTDPTCVLPSPAGPAGCFSELSLPAKFEVFSKGSNWMLHSLV